MAEEGLDIVAEEPLVFPLMLAPVELETDADALARGVVLIAALEALGDGLTDALAEGEVIGDIDALALGLALMDGEAVVAGDVEMPAVEETDALGETAAFVDAP